MSEHRRHRHNKKAGGKSFVILPVIFFIGIFTVLYVALTPAFGPLASAVGSLFSDTEKDYSTSYKNIFVPVIEETTFAVSEEKKQETPQETTQKTVDIEDVVFPNYGNQFGDIRIPDCGVECPLFLGDGDIALRNGVGVYYGSGIPGYGKTVLVAGHNNTFFNGLKNAAPGQEIYIRTSYGNFVYTVKETAVKDSLDVTAYDLAADQESLILYTCYPFDEIGLTSQRFFVYADYTSGVVIDKDTE